MPEAVIAILRLAGIRGAASRARTYVTDSVRRRGVSIEVTG